MIVHTIQYKLTIMTFSEAIMSEDWESHTGTLDTDEPWHNANFHHMSRSQQNVEIYKVVSSAVLNIQAEILASRARLTEVLARLEVAENDKKLKDQKKY